MTTGLSVGTCTRVSGSRARTLLHLHEALEFLAMTPYKASEAHKICCGLCVNRTKFAKDRNCVQYKSKSESKNTTVSFYCVFYRAFS